jgi:hypothetical protein
VLVIDTDLVGHPVGRVSVESRPDEVSSPRETMLATILTYAFELALAAAVLWYDRNLFLLYAFMRLLWTVNDHYVKTRNIGRLFQVANELRITAIARKLGVTPADIQVIYDEAKATMTAEQIEGLEKDFANLHRT